MRKIRKLSGILLAFAIVLGLWIPVFAESLGTYTITLNTGVPGGIYNVYPVIKENGGYVRKLGDWGSAGWDLSENTSPSANEFGEKMKGISIQNEGETVYPFADIDVGNADAVAKILDQNVVTDGTLKVDPPEVGYVLLRPDLAAPIYQELKHGATQNNQPLLHNAHTITMDQNGQGSFGVGQNEYFLITSGTPGTDESFVCIFRLVYGDGSVETPGPGDVIVDLKPKAETPEIHKTIGENPDESVNASGYDVGSRVTFTLKGTAPGLDKVSSYSYTMIDTLSKGLKFDADSVSVVIDGTAVDRTYYEISSPVITEDEKTEIRFRFGADESGLKSIPGISDNPTVIVRYEAVLTEGAFSTNKETNQVVLEYNNGGGIKTTPGELVNVYDFDVVVDKVARSEDGEKLSGAWFALLKGSEETGYQAYHRIDTGVEWVKVQAVPGQKLRDTLLQMEEQITVEITDEQGAAGFGGIAEGTYWLAEIKAPAQYSVLDELVAVTITAVYDENGELKQEAPSTIKQSADGEGYETTAKVINNSGSQLPETGGIGTTIFYIVGGILVLVAVVLLVTKKRMSALK